MMKLKDIREAFWRNFSEYSQDSSIHSIQYIGRKNLHWFERLFWFIAFFSSLCICSYLVAMTYQKWNSDPILVTFNEKSTPTWALPFPAVTICPEFKTNSNKCNISELIRKKNLTLNEMQQYKVLSQVCDELKVRNLSIQNDENYVEILREIQSDFFNISTVTKLGNKTAFLNKFFEVITEEGICFTYNMLDYQDIFRRKITTDLMYPKINKSSSWDQFGYKISDINAYPYRILGTGLNSGLKLDLKIRKKDVDYSCKGPANGFRLVLHVPGQLPRTSCEFYRVPIDMETLISVKPRIISTNENLINYNPQQRQCYFRGEKRLKFFRFYTKTNCLVDCLTDYTLKECNCVKFSMPRINGTKICSTVEELNCVEKARQRLSTMDLNSSMKKYDNTKSLQKYDKDIGDDDDNEYEHSEYEWNENHNDETDIYDMRKKSCKCLPTCRSIRYDAEISQTFTNHLNYFQASGNVHDDDSEFFYSSVKVYFKEDYFIESKRIELYNWKNFLANCGGFMGLLFGGSVLSLIEVIYYLTFRKIFKARKEKNDNEIKDLYIFNDD